MYDRLDHLGDTVFQHGPFNDRVYVMKTTAADLPELLPYLENLAGRRGYGKVIAKVPCDCRDAMLAWGAREEAVLPRYYRGAGDACFMARYFDAARRHEQQAAMVAEHLALADARAADAPSTADAATWDADVAVATPDDAGDMARIYAEVFPTYPFPIHDPAYLRQAMAANVVFFALRHDGAIGALASAEMDESNLAVEMTDFATLPALRGRGAAQALLQTMETAMKERGFLTGFTIARAYSAGMNITFAKCGYSFGGTLTNNTNIGGAIESMNVWHRPLSGASTATA